MIYPYKVKYDGIYYEPGTDVPSDKDKGVSVSDAPITVTEDKEEVVIAKPKKIRKK